jgi:Beta-lactamase superfamily domain
MRISNGCLGSSQNFGEMIQLQRLNMDSSWWIQWDATSFLIDPWLVGSEIDNFSWLNEQWHATPPMAISKIPPYQHIIISQPYSDHCHEITLAQLDQAAQIYAVPPARKRLHREMPQRSVIAIGEQETAWTTVGDLKVARLTPRKLLDPIYHALVIANQDEAIVYAPHGFKLSPGQQDFIAHLKVRLLITSFAYFRIPSWMGGVVNPGTEGAMALVEQLQPVHVLNSHDEDKHARGLVIKLAKRIYPDMKSETAKNPRVTALMDYSLISI